MVEADMNEASGTSKTCTVVGAKFTPCERPSLPDAPYPICMKHAIILLEFMSDRLAGNMDEQMRAAIAVTAKPPRIAAPRGGYVEDVVYYLRVGPLVKIGYSRNLPQRLLAYPPHAVLLATEPGDRAMEKQRHRQFAADRAERVEWFAPSPELIHHINDLRESPLTAAELAA